MRERFFVFWSSHQRKRKQTILRAGVGIILYDVSGALMVGRKSHPPPQKAQVKSADLLCAVVFKEQGASTAELHTSSKSLELVENTGRRTPACSTDKIQVTKALVSGLDPARHRSPRWGHVCGGLEDSWPSVLRVDGKNGAFFFLEKTYSNFSSRHGHTDIINRTDPGQIPSARGRDKN